MADKKKVISPEVYGDIVERAHLVDVKLTDSNFTIRPQFFGANEEELRYSYDCDLTSRHVNNDLLMGMFVLATTVKYSRKIVLKSRANYLIVFRIDGKPNEDAALLYLERVGAFGCWPYFRSHFANLCSDAGAVVPPLPIMKGNLPTKISHSTST
jgi:preprotein translocase subunit SecB